jgi:hypothetical protein
MKQKIEAVLLPLLTGALGFVLSPFFRGLWDWCANVALPALSKTQKLSLVAGLAILCLVLGFALYRASSKKLLIRKYEFQTSRGYWKHRKTGRPVCGNCLISGIESPLTFLSNPSTNPGLFFNSWQCGRKECGIEGFVDNAKSPDDI